MDFGRVESSLLTWFQVVAISNEISAEVAADPFLCCFRMCFCCFLVAKGCPTEALMD